MRRWKHKEKRPTKVTIYNRYSTRYRMSRAGVMREEEEEEVEEHEETATATMRGGTSGQARGRRYINNRSNKAGRKRGIKERRSKKRTRREEEGIVAPLSSSPFALSVPDLNSSRAPLRPFGSKANGSSGLLSLPPLPPTPLSFFRPSSSTSLHLSLSLSL